MSKGKYYEQKSIDFIKEFFIISLPFENRNAPYIAKFLLHKLFAIQGANQTTRL